MSRAMASVMMCGVLIVTGCSAQPKSLAEMGCDSIDTFLPELDAFETEPLSGEALYDLDARIQEEIRLEYFDNETLGLFRLMVEKVSDEAGHGFTPVDVDYPDMRRRAVSYCSGIGWVMQNA